MGDSFCIVREHPSLVDYIDMLQRKNAESLSFYPRQVFERERERGRLFLGLLNGDPCGYLYTGSARDGRELKCHQVCIQYDARRRLYGAALVIAMEQYAEESGAAAISLRCGFDLEANEFWKSLGYVCVAHAEGGARRMRTINVFRKQLRPDLLETIAIEPAVGKTSATRWSRHKQTGLVTQFHRGKRMRDYRLLLNV